MLISFIFQITDLRMSTHNLKMKTVLNKLSKKPVVISPSNKVGKGSGSS